jgi:hexosaminidase
MNQVIPKPFEIHENNDIFYFTNGISIITTIKSLSDYLEEILAFDKGIATVPSSNSQIQLILDENNELGQEGYEMEVFNTVISITSSTEIGLFYGIQTLRQLIQSENEKIFVEGVRIRDKPRFGWRGFMFDVGRHFHPVSTIKKCLDAMALAKMNIFHIGLTQDQGWRIEIKKYPKLTDIGSKRKDTKIGGLFSKCFRGEPHEGYYSQDDIRDIIQYAKNRHIEVIPEINMPGHSTAAIASYPFLSCAGKQLEVKSTFGIFKDIYCPGKESTFEFLQGVLDEIIELFPSDFIHIGGDEAPKKRWKACPHCQERIKSEGLKDEHELQVYFTNRIAKYIKSKGKRVIGWNEILRGGDLDDDTIVQWWIGKKKKMKPYLNPNRRFVMSNFGYTYLDYNYLMHPMRKFYRYEPVPRPKELYKKNILGVETPIWTEWVPNIDRLGWQVFPRFFAIAEVAWTDPKLKNYDEFKKRIPHVLRFLDKLEMPYADPEEVDPSNCKRFIHLREWMKWPEI